MQLIFQNKEKFKLHKVRFCWHFYLQFNCGFQSWTENQRIFSAFVEPWTKRESSPVDFALCNKKFIECWVNLFSETSTRNFKIYYRFSTRCNYWSTGTYFSRRTTIWIIWRCSSISSIKSLSIFLWFYHLSLAILHF